MFNFLKYRLVYFLISLIVICVGLFSIIKWGFKFSVDFVGGTNLEYQLERRVDIKMFKKIFEQNNIKIYSVSQKDTIVKIKSESIDEKQEKNLKEKIEKNLKIKINLLRFETVGPTMGKEMIKKTINASILAIFGILIYLSFAFKSFNYAIAAILAMIHDFLVVIGSYSLLSNFFGAEVDTLFVTALLITMSFSVHDTIVIFDKIREYWKENEGGNIEYLANKALNETIVRSFNNSMTIIFMLLSMALLGGSTIRFFIITLLVGTITGTYSSPFVATPILVAIEKMKSKKTK